MNVIAVYPGRFHPLHKGHAASFKQLAQKFGLANTYLAISAKQEQPKSPFSAQDRAMMASALGIPSKNIMAVSNPYMAKEYLDKVEMNGGDPDNTMLVFGVSKKDMEGDPSMGIAPDPRFSFKPKKDGSAPYMQPYSTRAMQNPQPMTKHAYVLSTDVAEFPIAGETMRDASAIRKAYAGADTNKKMRILTDLYGDAGEKMKQTFDNNLQVTESIRKLIATIKPLINEATPAQKAKFVYLLSEAKQRLDPKCRTGYKKQGTKMKGKVRVNNCVPKESMYEDESLTSNNPQGIPESTRKPTHKDGRDIDIVSDLGNNYYLSKDIDEDDDVRKVNYSVYTKVPDSDDMYTFVDFVQVSPYNPSREKLEAAIDKVIAADQDQLAEYNIPGTKRFIQQAHDKEQGQTYGDRPYSSHPRQVAAIGRRFFGPSFNSEAVKVALLHDILEDTSYQPEDLVERGFSPEVIEAVQLLTKDKSLSYAGNIRKIIDSKNPLAMMVKYCDNYMNYSGDKSHWSPEKAEASQKKYLASLDMLGSVLGIKKHKEQVTENIDYLEEK